MQQWWWTLCLFHGDTITPIVSPILSHTPLPRQTHSSCVAKPDLVSPSPGESGRLTNPTPPTTGHSNRQGRLASSSYSSRQVPPGRMTCVRRSYQEVGLSEGVISIPRRSWRESTESAYTYAWKQWVSREDNSAPMSSILRPLPVWEAVSHNSSENFWSLHESTMNDAILDSMPRPRARLVVCTMSGL